MTTASESESRQIVESVGIPVSKWKIANDIDLKYSKTLSQAIKKSLKILCYDCKFSPKGIKVNKKISLKVDE